ncbi:hypothetical protein GGX14DRAFT_667673 [Mycena pura]|uniref:Uncharacterized protein n=1 Tax=Mycena pura TaxID=153505 RepID=A0AAD6Y3T5_9AGAR|nr:hypothetical protein GGX14DRAFT_667673 [Mycena pura]
MALNLPHTINLFDISTTCRGFAFDAMGPLAAKFNFLAIIVWSISSWSNIRMVSDGEVFPDVVDPAVAEAWAEECRKPNPSGRPRPKAPDADFRANTARRLFAQLSATEQNEYRERAASEAKSRRDEYEQALKDGPSLEPAARQKCIENVAQFLGPILQGIRDCTYLQGIVMLGGPLPGNNGEIGTVHVALGQNLAPVPASFPAWAGERFNKEVLGVFKEYLRTAYTGLADEEIKEAALDPLADAQYRISTAPSDVQDSDDEDADDDDSDDSDDSDGEDDDEEDKEEEARSKEKGGMKGGKKRMRGTEDGERQKKKAKTQAQGPTYEEIRQANITRNKALLAEIMEGQSARGLFKGLSKPSQPRKPRQPKAPADGPVRRSGRHQAGETAEPMVNGVTRMADTGEEGEISRAMNDTTGTLPTRDATDDGSTTTTTAVQIGTIDTTTGGGVAAASISGTIDTTTGGGVAAASISSGGGTSSDTTSNDTGIGDTVTSDTTSSDRTGDSPLRALSDHLDQHSFLLQQLRRKQRSRLLCQVRAAFSRVDGIRELDDSITSSSSSKYSMTLELEVMVRVGNGCKRGAREDNGDTNFLGVSH